LLAAITLVAPHIANAQQTASLSLPDSAQLTTVSAPIPALSLAPAALASEAPATDSASLDATAQDQSAQSPATQQSSPDALPPATAQIRFESPKRPKDKPESEIAVEGMVSYGNWQIFAAGIDESLYTAGFEYERHTWGKFIGAQMDYAADFTPFVLLKEPAALNPYGVRRSRKGDNVYLHGLAFSPIGLRMEWRHDKAFKPYMTVLGGAIGFTKKALSPDASYYDFTLHESIGFYLRMSQRVDMRVGIFGDFHFSNAYITNYNPGLDVMNSQLAVSYHLGH
jgi:hypothetical protein